MAASYTNFVNLLFTSKKTGRQNSDSDSLWEMNLFDSPAKFAAGTITGERIHHNEFY